jgi:hypothetical protein
VLPLIGCGMNTGIDPIIKMIPYPTKAFKKNPFSELGNNT